MGGDPGAVNRHVQAPQPPSPQPIFGPVKLRFVRRNMANDCIGS